MDSIHHLTPEIQQRKSGFMRCLEGHDFNRAEIKNIDALMHGMLKNHVVYVSELGRALGEKISPKKTEERLHRNLRREGLGERLLVAHASKNRDTLQKKRYCIIDVSDIQKPYAEKMEGISRVRDGDKSSPGAEVIGNGYYWINGVMADKSGSIPIYSEIYSLAHEGCEHTSENSKLLGVIDFVDEVHPDAIYVLDRGGDRSALIDELLEKKHPFVIRGQSQRSLRLHRDSSKETNIESIARKTKAKYRYKSLRNGELFDVGLRRVYYGEHPVWLVVSHRCRGGLSWYLTTVGGTRKEIMTTVMEAYGLRWCVEEYHRQIKQDYSLEKICLRNYTAIKNMGVLVMLAASFCACLPDHLVNKLIMAAHLLPRKKLQDIPDYPLYMIVAAVAFALTMAVKRRPKPLRIRKRDYFQLSLPLEGV